MMSENQSVDGGHREAEWRKVDHRKSSDNDELVLSSVGRGAGSPDPLGADIRKCQTICGMSVCSGRSLLRGSAEVE